MFFYMLKLYGNCLQINYDNKQANTDDGML